MLGRYVALGAGFGAVSGFICIPFSMLLKLK
jgi:hypothetical protein